jgi:uncharacterized protein
MKLGVDIDGTIKNTQKAAVQVYNKELGRKVKHEDVTDFYLDKAYGLSKKEGARLWRKLEHKIYSLGVPLPNAAEVLMDLREKGHEVYFVTARPGMRHIRDVTVKWLQKHGFPYDGNNLHMGSRNKALVAQNLGIELFFEDAPDHLDKLVEAGVPTVVVDAVYNRDYNPKIPRIHKWEQVYDLIEKIEQK